MMKQRDVMMRDVYVSVLRCNESLVFQRMQRRYGGPRVRLLLGWRGGGLRRIVGYLRRKGGEDVFGSLKLRRGGLWCIFRTILRFLRLGLRICLWRVASLSIDGELRRIDAVDVYDWKGE
jgi:hypothetical protein